MSFFEKQEGRDSHFKISFKELPHLIEILRVFIQEIRQTKFGQLTPRLEQSPFKENDDRRCVGEYFSKFHTEYLPSQKLGVRQHMDSEGIWSIKFFAPREKSNYEDWHGCTMSMTLGHTREFISILEGCEIYINERLYDETD